MRTRMIILFFLSFVLSAQAQKAIKIYNKYDADYVGIPGTQLSIAPPADFELSERFKGFEHKLSGASIMVVKVPGDIHQSMMAFPKNQDPRKGMVVSKEEMYKINGYEALLQTGAQMAHGKSYYRARLIIGDLQTTYLLNASYYVSSGKEFGEKIVKALLSVIYSPGDATNTSEAFPFTIDISGTGLQSTDVLLNSLIFTDDGNVPSKTDAKSSLMVTHSRLIQAPKDQEAYVLKALQSYPVTFSSKQELQPKSVKINGLKGYEVYGIGQNEKLKKAEMIYLVFLFDGKNVYRITGTCFKYFEENLKSYQKAAKTFIIFA